MYLCIIQLKTIQPYASRLSGKKMKKFNMDEKYAWSKYKAVDSIVWIAVTAVTLLGFPIAVVIALY